MWKTMQISGQSSRSNRTRQGEIGGKTQSLESKHSPPSGRAEIRDPNGSNLGLWNHSNHSLFPTVHIFTPTGHNHGQTTHRFLQNPSRLYERFHSPHNAHNHRLIRPHLHPHRPPLHRPRPRHYLPQAHGHRPCNLNLRHIGSRLRWEKAQACGLNSRPSRSPLLHHPHFHLLACPPIQPPWHGRGFHVHWPSRVLLWSVPWEHEEHCYGSVLDIHFGWELFEHPFGYVGA